jgi:hypothetical protein
MRRELERFRIVLSRRNLLICLAGLFAAPAAIVRGMGSGVAGGKIVIVDGWVLLEDDLRKLPAHVV